MPNILQQLLGGFVEMELDATELFTSAKFPALVKAGWPRQ